MITDNNSWPASEADFCAAAVGINGTNSAMNCDDPQHVSVAFHPAVYFFVVAQLLVGFGGCGILILSSPYIDENSAPSKSALYIGVATYMF